MNLKDFLTSVLLVGVLIHVISFNYWPRDYGKNMRAMYDQFMMGWNGQ